MENELRQDDENQVTGDQLSVNGADVTSDPVKPKYDKSDPRSNPNYEKAAAMKLRQRTEEEQRAMCYPPGMLTLKAANTWIQESNALPIPKMLFSEFWREGEISILFADNNLGKSILGVQIGDSISRGEAIPGFKMECTKQPVVYFDFELSGKQFESRYSRDFTEHYKFDEQFMRVEISPAADIPPKMSVEEHLCNSVENSLIDTDAKIVIIDNITYLNHGGQRTSQALKLMRRLKDLKHKLNLSVLVIAHTAKRTVRKRIGRDDVQGGKRMMQYCDSAFCIGESASEKNLRYLKQVKCVSTDTFFNLENVALCRVAKPHNFLKFDFLSYGMEWEMTKGMIDEVRQEMIAYIKKRYNEGRKQRQIAAEMKISVGTVNKYLNKV